MRGIKSHLNSSPPSFSDNPKESDCDKGAKDILFTASICDGQVFPPVIFTPTEPPPPDVGGTWHSDGDREHVAYVVHMPGISSPTSECMIRWMDLLQRREWNFFADDTELILDRAPWHMTKSVGDRVEEAGITPHFLPSGAGAYLNSMDQSFHREFRRSFVKLQHTRGPQFKLQNMISAYYSVTEDTVRGSWAPHWTPNE